MQRLRAREINLTMSSGTVRSRGFYGETDIKVSSGNVICDELDGPTHRITVSSGGAKIQKGRGSIDGSVTSGNLNLEMAELNDNLSLTTSSGSIRLSLPPGAAFNLDAETTSGHIDVRSADGSYRMSDRSTVVRPIGENPRHTVLVRVRSGSIEIMR
jgi:DUF4097 and DUF4098 domain-containing protein YvlB